MREQSKAGQHSWPDINAIPRVAPHLSVVLGIALTEILIGRLRPLCASQNLPCWSCATLSLPKLRLGDFNDAFAQ